MYEQYKGTIGGIMIMRGGTMDMRVWEVVQGDERYQGYKRYKSWHERYERYQRYVGIRAMRCTRGMRCMNGIW